MAFGHDGGIVIPRPVLKLAVAIRIPRPHSPRSVIARVLCAHGNPPPLSFRASDRRHWRGNPFPRPFPVKSPKTTPPDLSKTEKSKKYSEKPCTPPTLVL